MADEFKDGDVVWVKCGTLFWPATVVDYNNLPDEIKEDFPEGNEKPKTIAKFFDEDGYEYLFDNKNIFPYNCSKKEEFIKKGLAKSKSKSKEGATSGWFSKFPNDVIKSEKLTDGDEKILDKEPYTDKPSDKINYKELFGQSAQQKEKVETPKSAAAKKRKADSSPVKKTPQSAAKKKKEAEKPSTPARPIVHPRFMEGGSGSDHKVKILPQPSAPYHIDLQMKQEKLTSAAANSYTCHICGFTATRINVIVLHSKSHSEPAKSALASNKSASVGRKPVPPTPAPSPKSVKKPVATLTPPSTPKAASAKKTASSSTSAASATKKETNSTPKQTPKTKAATTTKTEEKPATDTPRRARSRSAAAPAPPPVSPKKSPRKNAATAVVSDAPNTAKGRKPRMTKKKKELIMQEKEKKEEERKKIMGEWSEEEEGEAEEQKKINETLGKSDDNSDNDSDREAFLGDDHVHGYDDDDDDEEESIETKEVKPANETSEPEKENTTNGETEKEDKETAENIKETEEAKVEEEKKEEQTEIDEELKSAEAVKEVETETEPEVVETEPEVVAETEPEVENEPPFDIDKVLAETAVPEVSADFEFAVKKSVKFSQNLSKDIALKTIRVMQPESNLTDPQDVDDEFAFTEEPKIPELMSTKTILKRSRSKLDCPFKQSPTKVAHADLTVQHVQLTSDNSPVKEKHMNPVKERHVSPVKEPHVSPVKEPYVSHHVVDSQVKHVEPIAPSQSNAVVKLTFNAPAEELTDEDKEQDSEPVASTNETISQDSISSEAEQAEDVPTIQHQIHEQDLDHQEQIQNHSIPAQMVLHTSEGQQLQVHNGDGGEHEGETYILLVDDDENAGAHLESLNSQTLYIDSSSLTNGDLSNMVLMTGPSHSADGDQVGNQVMTFSTGANTLTTNAAGTITLTSSSHNVAQQQEPMEQ